jgi:hypothetical protein
MKPVRVTLATLLLFLCFAPRARADFQYTETSQVTGGTLVKMMKSLSFFAKKQTQEALKPTISTHSVKGSRLRMDETDGTSEIIDLDGRRIIGIDNNKKTYSIITFDQMQAAMQQAMQNLQQAQAQQPAPQQDATPQNVQLTVTPTFKVTPGTGNRVILSQPTNETKIEMDLAMQGTATGDAAPPPGQPNSATVSYTMNMDTYVAPNVSGYMEFAEFYRRMATQANWIKLPADVHVTDPRVAQGLSTLKQNSDALKGFPLLSYTNMTLTATNADGTPLTAQNDQSSTSNSSQSSAPNSSNNKPTNTSSNTTIDSPSAALTKGLGSLFNKRKQDKEKNASSADASQPAAAPNTEASDNDLIEITTQVTKFSDSSLDGSLFDIPSGFTLVPADPAMPFGGQATQPTQPRK